MRSFFKGFTVLLAAATLLSLCIMVVGCGSKQRAQDEGVQKQVDEAVNKEINKQLNTSEDDGRTQKGPVGDTFKVGEAEVKVVGWKFATPQELREQPEQTGNKLVVVDVEVTNAGSRRLSCDSSLMSVRTPEGYSYDTWGWAVPEPQFPSTDIEPGGKSRGYVTFGEVPANIGSLEFQYDSVVSGKALVKLQ